MFSFGHCPNEGGGESLARIKTLPEAQRTQKLTPWLGLNLATTWHLLHLLQIWPPDGATCNSCKFGHQMAPLALDTNLATRWHHLHQLQIWPSDGATCIVTKAPDGVTCFSSKFGHQLIAQLVLVAYLATEWHNLDWFKIWSSGGAIFISCKFDQRWRHLHRLQIWPPDGATCISYKFDHQMAPLASVPNSATRWRYLHWF